VLSTISAIAESLSIANSPKLVLEMTLETLSQTLEIECGWIQMITVENSSLELVAHQGFHFKERLENVILEVSDVYHREIIGLGNSLVVPNLRNDTRHFTTLNNMGYRWLVAVPMRNHRLAGVMSIASRKKRKINGDFGEFMAAIAGLAIMAYEKSSEKASEGEKIETPAQSIEDKSLLELETDEWFGKNSELDRQVIESSPRETDLLDAMYSRKQVDQMAARFNSDVETVRNDIESIRNRLIENYQSRRYAGTMRRDSISENPVNQKSPSSDYVTRAEFNDFKQSLKTFLSGTLDLLDDV